MPATTPSAFLLDLDGTLYSGNAATIRNQGLIQNTGAGTLRIDPFAFANQSGGTVRAQSGTVNITPGGVINESGGTFDVNGGTLNLIGPEQRIRAARLVREGTTVSCAHPINTVGDSENTSPAVHTMVRAGDVANEPGVRSTQDYLAVAPHGVAHSHLDALCHFYWRGCTYNGRPVDVVTSLGASECDHDRSGRDRLARRPARSAAPVGRRVVRYRARDLGRGDRGHRGRSGRAHRDRRHPARAHRPRRAKGCPRRLGQSD
jgi:hypothetical protein